MVEIAWNVFFATIFFNMEFTHPHLEKNSLLVWGGIPYIPTHKITWIYYSRRPKTKHLGIAQIRGGGGGPPAQIVLDTFLSADVPQN